MGPLLSNPELHIKLQMMEMGDKARKGEWSGIALDENNGVVKFKCLPSHCVS